MVGLFGVTVLFEPGGLVVKVRTCQLVVEVQRDVGQLFQSVEEAFVEIGTVYGLDVLERVKCFCSRTIRV